MITGPAAGQDVIMRCQMDGIQLNFTSNVMTKDRLSPSQKSANMFLEHTFVYHGRVSKTLFMSVISTLRSEKTKQFC